MDVLHLPAAGATAGSRRYRHSILCHTQRILGLPDDKFAALFDSLSPRMLAEMLAGSCIIPLDVVVRALELSDGELAKLERQLQRRPVPGPRAQMPHTDWST